MRGDRVVIGVHEHAAAQVRSTSGARDGLEIVVVQRHRGRQAHRAGGSRCGVRAGRKVAGCQHADIRPVQATHAGAGDHRVLDLRPDDLAHGVRSKGRPDADDGRHLRGRTRCCRIVGLEVRAHFEIAAAGQRENRALQNQSRMLAPDGNRDGRQAECRQGRRWWQADCWQRGKRRRLWQRWRKLRYGGKRWRRWQYIQAG